MFQFATFHVQTAGVLLRTLVNVITDMRNILIMIITAYQRAIRRLQIVAMDIALDQIVAAARTDSCLEEVGVYLSVIRLASTEIVPARIPARVEQGSQKVQQHRMYAIQFVELDVLMELA